VFAAKYQLKRVTVAVLICASFHCLCCLMNRKGKYLNEQCCYRNNKIFCGVNSYNNRYSSAVFWHWHSPTSVLPLVYCPADDTFFEVGPEIRCSGVSCHYCFYRNHTARFKPIYKVNRSQWRIECGLSVPKIVNVVNWWSYVILIVAVQFFETRCIIL